MPSIHDVYPYYLSASNLQGRTVIVTVEKTKIEEVYNAQTRKKEPKLLVFFVGKKLSLACNKTQAAAIARIAGNEDYTKWAGVSFSLQPTRASNGKDTINVIGTSAQNGSHADLPTGDEEFEGDDEPL